MSLLQLFGINLVNTRKFVWQAIFFLTLSVSLQAQPYATKYYDANGKEVVKEQAYYVAIGTIPGGKNYFVGKVVEKYVSNKKIKAKRTYDQTGKPTGVTTEYFENGQMKEKYQLKNGYVFGGYVSWYPNGQKELEREYTAYSNATEINHRTYNHWDSLGNQLAKDGTGALVEYHTDYTVAANGKIYKGNRSGTWKGYYPNGNTFYTEKYKNGELISGKSILTDSSEYSYTQINQLPAPKIGFAEYYKRLTKAMRYPKSAKKIGLQGTVHIAYTVSDSGQIADYYVLKSLSEDCDNEALRMFEEVPVEWIAGTSRGNPKSYILTLPVSFKL
ncbi:MAG: TonB family protein [Reichenbachiella sp.]|uniref:TonB family protein n=1 Tax=Reichenbachiella sp. TaxID=2184521 RepID=UPI003263CCB7